MDVVGCASYQYRPRTHKYVAEDGLRRQHTEWPALTRQVPDNDLHISALATGRAADLNLAGDAALGRRQDGLVSGARRVVQSGGGISSQGGERCKRKSQKARWKEVAKHGWYR